MNRDDIRQRIAERAYSFFVARGYEHGHDKEDWFRAERELLAEFQNLPVDEDPVAKPEETGEKRTAVTKPSTKKATSTKRRKKE